MFQYNQKVCAITDKVNPEIAANFVLLGRKPIIRKLTKRARIRNRKGGEKDKSVAIELKGLDTNQTYRVQYQFGPNVKLKGIGGTWPEHWLKPAR